LFFLPTVDLNGPITAALDEAGETQLINCELDFALRNTRRELLVSSKKMTIEDQQAIHITLAC
jgi:hypothetical protein